MIDYEHRVINGLLKTGSADVADPEHIQDAMATNIELWYPAHRASELEPSIWALEECAVRHFTGSVSRVAVATSASSRCIQSEAGTASPPFRIGVGAAPPSDGARHYIWGDVRGANISYGTLLEGDATGHPISQFALAGYLSFASLALAFGIPEYRSHWRLDRLSLPFDTTRIALPQELCIVGCGQLGQAYLALLHFMQQYDFSPSIVLLDYQRFERPNRSTQLLLDASHDWEGIKKVDFLAAWARHRGLVATALDTQLTWDSRLPASHPRLALIGVDNLEARRIASTQYYDHVIEAGVGVDFGAPRVTWHVLSGRPPLANVLFEDPPSVEASTGSPQPASELERALRNTPGQCGWLTFRNIAASTPSLGLVAAAYAFCEFGALSSSQMSRGSALLWSPLLPYERTPLT